MNASLPTPQTPPHWAERSSRITSRRRAGIKFGRVDYAVNNAGVAGPRLTPVADVTEAQWDEVSRSASLYSPRRHRHLLECREFLHQLSPQLFDCLGGQVAFNRHLNAVQ